MKPLLILKIKIKKEGELRERMEMSPAYERFEPRPPHLYNDSTNLMGFPFTSVSHK